MPDQEGQPSTAADIDAALRNALEHLGDTLEKDELAYLTVTSKVEGPVRDRIAWALRAALGPDYVIAREYRRADLAVLTPDGGLLAQVEAKVLCTFNALNDKDRARFLRYLASDADKMATLPPSEHFLLSIVVDVSGNVPAELIGVVKYAPDINRCAKKRLRRQGPGGRAADLAPEPDHRLQGRDNRVSDRRRASLGARCQRRLLPDRPAGTTVTPRSHWACNRVCKLCLSGVKPGPRSHT